MDNKVNNNGFARWLNGELASRSWKQADLSNRAKLLGKPGASQSIISRIMRNEIPVSDATCIAIAAALSTPDHVIPPERVMEHAGILKSGGEIAPEMKVLNARVNAFPPIERRMLYSAFDSMTTAAEVARQIRQEAY